MSFNQQLAALRKARGISQEALADMLGVSRQAVSKWETGETQPEMANLMALCEILRVSPNQLMGWEEAGDKEVAGEVVCAPSRKKSKLALAIAVICVCLALAAGIFMGRSMAVSAEPQSPLEGVQSVEITGFIYEFAPFGSAADLKLIVMPGIADESLEYEIIRLGAQKGEESYPVAYKDGVCTAYVETVVGVEAVYALRISDGKNVVNKPLFKVYAYSDNHYSHEELWQD